MASDANLAREVRLAVSCRRREAAPFSTIYVLVYTDDVSVAAGSVKRRRRDVNFGQVMTRVAVRGLICDSVCVHCHCALATADSAVILQGRHKQRR